MKQEDEKNSLKYGDDVDLLLYVLSHTGAVLAESLGINHAIEVLRGNTESERDILGVTHHSHLRYYVVLWDVEIITNEEELKRGRAENIKTMHE